MKRARKKLCRYLRGFSFGMEELFMTPFGKMTSVARQATCDHSWERDGQTLTAVRWVCTKCYETKLS